MTIEDAVDILHRHNIWRRSSFGDAEAVSPTELGIAIDLVCAALSWRGIRRIVQVADDLLKVEYTYDDEGNPIVVHNLPDFCDTEEHYYTEVLKKLCDEDKS